MRKLLCMLIVFLTFLPASGSNAADKDIKEGVVSTSPVEGKEVKSDAAGKEWKNHFKFYGFIRNYFSFDTRESVSGTGNLFYYLPKDRKLNDLGEDLNAQPSFRFLSLTTRLGVDVSGYRYGRTYFGAKVEGDFYTGLSGSTGTAQARLRQAYVSLGWKELAMAGEQTASVSLKIGQAWHPMAADMPQIFSLEVGAPFGPFSRTPQVTMDADLGSHWTITGSLLWQMQYTSAGPSWNKDKESYESKASADYIKYGCTPEAYAGLSYKTGGFLVRLGADVLSIKPRVNGFKDGQQVKVSDRITTVSSILYAQYRYKDFMVKAKSVYGAAGEHFNLNSGYAKIGENEDGSWDYAPLHSSSSWLALSYGKKVQGVLFLGYMKNLGLSEPQTDPVKASDIFFSKNGFSNIAQMYRINPEVVLNLGKFQFGLEWQYTAVQYGDYDKVDDVSVVGNDGIATSNLHWVANNRVQAIVKFTF